MFLDLKKALGTVDHNILIKKLELYGIRGTELLWFTSYLNERTQVCKLGKTLSSKTYIKTGVPQGSNLGPLLFLVYINDLPNCLSNSTPALFADDTNVTVTGTSIQDIEAKLNGELNNLHCWIFNASKLEYMIIGSRKRLLRLDTDPHVFINNQIIDRVDNTKTLGVFIDEKISHGKRILIVYAKKCLRA